MDQGSQSAILIRPRLEDLLGAALGGRLTTVIAGPGFGKTTLLRGRSDDPSCIWYTVTERDHDLNLFARSLAERVRLGVPHLPTDLVLAAEGVRGPDADADELRRADAYAALLSTALAEQVEDRLVLVIDDVEELGGAPGPVRLVESLCRQAPQTVHMVLASREQLPFPIGRLRGRGEVTEITASDLALTAAEVDDLVTERLGDGGPAEALYEATQGWPVAVRFGIEALVDLPADRRNASLDRLRRPGGPVFDYVAEEVFAREPEAVRILLRRVAPLEGFTPELCGVLGIPNGSETFASLLGRGFLFEVSGSDFDVWVLAPLLRQFILERHPVDPAEGASIHRAAADWFEQQGHLVWSGRSLAAADDTEALTRFLERRGDEMLLSGYSRTVDDLCRLLDATDPAIARLHGQARQVLGNWEGALECFSTIAPVGGTIPAGVAWRMGLIHHLRGHLDEALACYQRGRLDDPDRRDVVLLRAWRAAVAWLRGDEKACRVDAEAAMATAREINDHQASAAAHTVLAMLAALDGDRRANEGNYLRALKHAEQAHDVLQTIRIRVNRGSHLFEEDNYGEAIDELDVALRLADLAGFATFRALALTNRGATKARLGFLEEARADLEAAHAMYAGLESRLAAYPLTYLGEVHEIRGAASAARTAYEEALALSVTEGDLQGLVPALVGLSRLTLPDDPETALKLADQALAEPPSLDYAAALLASAAATADPDEARDRARFSIETARTRRDRSGVARGLELLASLAPEDRERRGLIEEAHGIWDEVGDPVGLLRVDMALAALRSDPELATSAAKGLRSLGARALALEAETLVAELAAETGPDIAVECLGGFRVLRRGEPVRQSEWQSRKARDLLKLLVARRGRPVHREQLVEALWPDEDPERTSNRLSVALSTVRGVLDPHKDHPPDRFLAADRSTMHLDLDHVIVDIEMFVADAEVGLATDRRPGPTERLRAAEARYRGDFLEEDAYEDWALPVREELRGLYLQVARALATRSTEAGDHDAAVRYHLRVLEHDPYDEQAHLGLVEAMSRTRRHGEARRLYRSYVARMDELGIEAASFPVI